MSGFIDSIREYGVLEALPVSLAAAAVYLAVRAIPVRSGAVARKPWLSEAAGVLLTGYIAALLMIVWITRWTSWDDLVYMISHYGWMWQDGYHYVNNGRIWRFFSGGLMEYERFEVLANLVLFVPLGFLLPIFWRGLKWWQVDLICLGTTVVVELVQPLINGIGDLDDVIANALGGIVGCAAAKALLFVGKCVSTRKSGAEDEK